MARADWYALSGGLGQLVALPVEDLPPAVGVRRRDPAAATAGAEPLMRGDAAEPLMRRDAVVGWNPTPQPLVHRQSPLSGHLAADVVMRRAAAPPVLLHP